MAEPTSIIENRDALQHLRSRGFGPLLAALSDPNVYTLRGRIVLASIARRLKCSPRRVSSLLCQARLALE